MTATAPTRRVGVGGAVGIGLGSMLGAGVFVVWGPAAAAAPGTLVAAVAIAGAVAAINAGSSAQLAAVHPVAGGAYAYGRAELGPWPGFVAGLAFVLGKTASIAAIALAVGAYLWPGHAAFVGTIAIVGAWNLNSRGVTRTSAAAVVLASCVVSVLTVLIITLALQSSWSFGWFAYAPIQQPLAVAGTEWPGGTLQAAALLFFAFAGYARIATLGEEVKEAARTIPRAIAIALSVVVVIYGSLAIVLPHALGTALADLAAPISAAAATTWIPSWVIVVAAIAAAFGSLLALTAGVGRTAMAMAREGDLPRPLARANGHGVPALAESVAAVVAIGLVWAGGLTFAIAMSAFAVLLYYAVANAAAWRASRVGHIATWRMPWPISALGLILCVALALWLPIAAVVVATGVLVLGVAVRAVSRLTSRE